VVEKTGYQEDLAYIHDVGFGNFARQAAPAVLDLLRTCGFTNGLVVDLGCGSGLLAAELVRAGYDVLGVDYSAALLKIARQRVPEARFRRASFLDVNLPACVAVTALGEIFNFLFDVQNSRAALEAFFGRVYQALQPGGLFLFDVAAPGRLGGPGKHHRNAQGEDWAVQVQAEEDPERLILTRHITSFRRVGTLYRRSEEVHRLQLYRGRDLVAALRGLGFRARLLRRYGEFRFPPGWISIAARKASRPR
jgi:SAM-dependent methyltransferase